MGKYINVALPEEMIIEIGKTIEKSNLGYKSKSEFVKEAVRTSLKELAKYDETKKFEAKSKK
ncbi:hypothetical protein J4207_03260 [Candidatus Woesearchaeota archaeon]|nr:hypothetical protein [Candidatus Woesearchaeota archaeon]